MLHKNDCEILAHICASLQAGRMASLGGKCFGSKKKQPFGCFPLPVRTPELMKFFFNIYYMSYMPRSSAEGITVRTASASASISVLVYPVTEFAKRSPESVKH